MISTCIKAYTYTVATRTHDRHVHGSKWMSSDANLRIQLHGTKGASGYHPNLDTDRDDLECNSIDVFHINLKDAGDLQKIDVLIWDDNDKWGAKWIAVRDDARGKAWRFNTPHTFYEDEEQTISNPIPINPR